MERTAGMGGGKAARSVELESRQSAGNSLPSYLKPQSAVNDRLDEEEKCLLAVPICNTRIFLGSPEGEMHPALMLIPQLDYMFLWTGGVIAALGGIGLWSLFLVARRGIEIPSQRSALTL